MDGTARRTQIFRLGVAPQGVLRLIEVLQRMMVVLAEAVSRLKKGDDVMKYAVEAKTARGRRPTRSTTRRWDSSSRKSATPSS